MQKLEIKAANCEFEETYIPSIRKASRQGHWQACSSTRQYHKSRGPRVRNEQEYERGESLILIGAVNGKCQDTTVTKHAKQECKEAKRARSDLLFFVNLLCYIYLYIKKNEKKYLHKKSLGKRSLTLLQKIHFIRFIPTSDHQKAPHLGKIAPVDVDPESNHLKSIKIRCFQCKVKLTNLKEFEILWKPTQIASYNHLLTISVCFYMFLRLSNLFILHCYSVQSK